MLMQKNTVLAIHLLFIVVLLAAPGTVYSGECPEIDHEHAEWSAILQNWVNDGRVNYSALKNEGRAPLESYLMTLSAACAADYLKWSREQQIAFWINAYNAFTIKLIVDNYPIKSIRDIGWLPAAAFRKNFIPMPGLKGETISLNDIEHNTLRADFQEPRIHFALVCASIGCPPLSREAYRASDLDRQLDQQAQLFLHDTSKNRFDPENKTLYLSPIFKWFKPDFEMAAGSVPAFVEKYMGDTGISKQGVQTEYTDYDWSLNDKLPGD